MRIENTNKLSYTTSKAITNNNLSDSFAKMLEKYSQDSSAVNSHLATKTTPSSFRSLLLLQQEESKQIKEAQDAQKEKESRIQQLEKELLQVKQIEIPTRNPEDPWNLVYEAFEINNYKNSQISKIQKEITFLSNSAFGYSLDENGFMGEDFNKAAGIPLDYKIHYDTLDDIYQFHTLQKSPGIPAIFSQVDLAQTAKNAFESFRNFYGENFTQNNKMLSQDELDALPKGFFTDYSYKNVFAVIPTKEALTQLYDIRSSGIYKLGIDVPPFVDCSINVNEVAPYFKQDDKISLDGMFNEYLKNQSPKFKVAEYSQEWLDYEAYNNKITGRSNTKDVPNTYSINFDETQRFWDLLSGKISVESHLKELIDLGYTHNGTINWSEDKDKFSSGLSYFLKVFQEILDSQSLSAQEFQALNNQIPQQSIQTKQESEETKDSKPYESKSKQEKMDTFLNNLLKVG